ncbi:MAG: hypothetical protein DWQ36_20760 [Acidobacteria bacterium]|nr:MAG: hypothetical protein DWQ30_21185 [Acidobacteriota bacterium]REK03296.1 MAG: hypothetical protein DWQ36_20760 [Acidobacteriota bacterium]
MAAIALVCGSWLLAAPYATVLGQDGSQEQATGASSESGETEEYKNTIRWATASEVDNFGFDVFRGEAEDGPFAKINDDPIEGGGTTDSPRHYSYVDDTIDPHQVYFYYVESIALDGTREQFTPIAKVGPKIKPGSEASDADRDAGDSDDAASGDAAESGESEPPI